MDYKEQLNKHMCDLPCPICKRPVYFKVDSTLRTHLSQFHRRVDLTELTHLSKVMCGIEEAQP